MAVIISDKQIEVIFRLSQQRHLEKYIAVLWIDSEVIGAVQKHSLLYAILY